MPKRDLTAGLSAPASQPLVRGKGYNLSTTNPDVQVEDVATSAPAAEVEKATKPQVAKEPAIKRDNAKLDPNIIQEYKLLAVKQRRKLYEVMEEALEEYLEKHKVAE